MIANPLLDQFEKIEKSEQVALARKMNAPCARWVRALARWLQPGLVIAPRALLQTVKIKGSWTSHVGGLARI